MRDRGGAEQQRHPEPDADGRQERTDPALPAPADGEAGTHGEVTGPGGGATGVRGGAHGRASGSAGREAAPWGLWACRAGVMPRTLQEIYTHYV
ncbi:hypothetical protein HOK021_63220 [Streptomyces hygroscopicus]|nr:hypothetical protein HOK021_63220 [Streptomyces hygroscopicus]